jgi:hypothetical protein
MSEGNYGSLGNEGAVPEQVRQFRTRPYWKRMHHSLVFWVGMGLVTAAITIYVISDNLALMPHRHPHQALPSQLGQ